MAASVRPLSTAGFTLIEVLVAFAVASLILGISLRLIMAGLSRDATETQAVMAALEAQSLLAELDAAGPPSLGERYGMLHGHHYRLAVRPSSRSLEFPEAEKLRLFEIEITVGWDDADLSRSVSLITERLVTTDSGP